MVDHVRYSVKSKILELLQPMLDAGAIKRLEGNTVMPSDVSQVPAVSVVFVTEAISTTMTYPRTQKRQLTIDVICSTLEGVENNPQRILDGIIAEVENRLAAVDNLGGVVKNFTLLSTDFERDELEQTTNRTTLHYACVYFTKETDATIGV
jgi:hypothetical protein